MEFAVAPAEKLEVHVGGDVAPRGFAWLVPFRRGDAAYVKAGVLLWGDARAYLEKFLARLPIAPRLQETTGELVRRLLPIAPVAKSYADRVVAVGDAAGLTKPVSGGWVSHSPPS